MSSVSQGTGYAIRALGCLADASGKPVLIKSIAELCRLPPAFLSKLINRLSHADFVRTQRGVHGGVTLARPAHLITLRDVCDAFDDSILENRCLLSAGHCTTENPCPARVEAATCRDRMDEFLGATTVADIAAMEAMRPWGVAEVALIGPADL